MFVSDWLMLELSFSVGCEHGCCWWWFETILPQRDVCSWSGVCWCSSRTRLLQERFWPLLQFSCLADTIVMCCHSAVLRFLTLKFVSGLSCFAFENCWSPTLVVNEAVRSVEFQWEHSLSYILAVYSFNIFWICTFVLWLHSGGYLTVTDANLILGRIIPEYFPHIFGEKENEPLDIVASRAAFQQLVDDVRSSFPFDEHH